MNERAHVFPQTNPIGAVLSIDPGEGNLDWKAYIAAVLGPKRLAHGARKSKTLQEDTPTKISVNAGQQRQVSFVFVVLEATNPGPIIALVSSGASIGVNSGVPVSLTNTPGSAAGLSYSEVMLPGESLYMQSAPGSGTFGIIVSESYF